MIKNSEHTVWIFLNSNFDAKYCLYNLVYNATNCTQLRATSFTNTPMFITKRTMQCNKKNKTIYFKKLFSAGLLNLELWNITIIVEEAQKDAEIKTTIANIDRLNATLDKLTPKQKEVIFLKFYEQLSYTEIAQIMKVDVKAIYKLMARAIGSLRSDFLNLFLFL